MALPGNLVTGLLPTEAEYIATSSVEINVVPLMKIDKVRLLSGVYGPLRPPTQARLPLWLALNLKKRKRCSIICPEWMQLDNLRKLHREETMNEAFAPVPLHYISIAKALLESASEDIPQSDEIRAVLKSLREARQSKIMTGLGAINSEHLNMTNISLGEVTELRDFLTTAQTHLRTIERAIEPEDGTQQQQQQLDNGNRLSFGVREQETEVRKGDTSHTRVELDDDDDDDDDAEESRNNDNMDLF